MTNMKLDRDTLRALANEGNEKALDRLADLADAGGDLAELNDLLDDGSEHAGRLLTRRAVKAHDVIELQRLSDAGSEQAGTELDRILASGHPRRDRRPSSTALRPSERGRRN